MKHAVAKHPAGHPAPAADQDWLSALLDGELDDDAARAALARLKGDGEAGGRWAEYSLIGDALRGDQGDSARFRARFQAALAAEPTVLAPAKPRLTPASALWVAAAAAVAAITWTVLESGPESQPGLPMAQAPLATAEVDPYLAAHQDFAHAVVATPEMRLTPVTLAEAR